MAVEPPAGPGPEPAAGASRPVSRALLEALRLAVQALEDEAAWGTHRGESSGGTDPRSERLLAAAALLRDDARALERLLAGPAAAAPASHLLVVGTTAGAALHCARCDVRCEVPAHATSEEAVERFLALHPAEGAHPGGCPSWDVA